MTNYATDFPLAKPESAHWTERVVTEGHAAYCRENGHATYTKDGVVLDFCPRCGDGLEAKTDLRPLSAIFTGRELLRIGRAYSKVYAPDPRLSKVEFDRRRREIAATLYPEKV